MKAIEDITPETLKERLEKGEKINILDVREGFEFEEYNINGKLIPLAELPHRLEEIADWKNEEIVVHCKSGGRSANAQKYLISQGFSNVRNLLTGALGYQNLP